MASDVAGRSVRMPSPSALPKAHATKAPRRPTLGNVLSLPPQWLAMYEEFITKNAGQVSQIESALRSLTYIIPGEWTRETTSGGTIPEADVGECPQADFAMLRLRPSRYILSCSCCRYTTTTC